MMEQHNVLGAPVFLQTACARGMATQKILLLEVGAEEVSVALSAGGVFANGQAQLSFKPGWRGLLLLDGLGFCTTSDRALCCPINLVFFTKLLAFADEARGIAVVAEPGELAVALEVPQTNLLREQRTAEEWFVSLIYRDQAEFSALFSLLRRTEYYRLIRFLLSETIEGDSLHTLGERYGVSYSHFRRLCQQALGGATKTELRAWRLARALLDPIAETSFTDVALKYGYASSSHFSNEVKELLGVSPRNLSNIVNIAVK